MTAITIHEINFETLYNTKTALEILNIINARMTFLPPFKKVEGCKDKVDIRSGFIRDDKSIAANREQTDLPGDAAKKIGLNLIENSRQIAKAWKLIDNRDEWKVAQAVDRVNFIWIRSKK
jgi:hypothetical protein